jgi:hypothetical protein
MHGGKAMASDTSFGGSPWRIAGWGLAALVILTPFLAMQFTSGVNWTGSDFIFAALLIGGVGLLFELTVRMSNSRYYRAGVGLALAAGFLTIWASGAVGMIGNEDNPLNLMFGGVLAIALLGSAIAGFRPAGMVRAMAAAAAAQLVASMIGMFTDLRGGIFSALFSIMWLASAALFRTASQQRSIAA